MRESSQSGSPYLIESGFLMSIGVWQVALVLLLVLVIFGAGKLPKVMGDVAAGIKNFKQGIRDDDESFVPLGEHPDERAVMVRRVPREDEPVRS